MYIVCRPFEAGGRRLEAGRVVDAASWRNLNQLVRQRYLRPQTTDDVDAARETTPAPKRGREVK